MKKRLRRKLPLREFPELGFHVGFEVAIASTREAEDAFFDKLFAFTAAQALSIGGSMNSFYVTRSRRNTTTEADREASAAWRHQQPEVSAAQVWPLDDAWHGPFKWL
jgi:uncharacterized protein YggL (DUF469 family)